jgi:hypothetical protein
VSEAAYEVEEHLHRLLNIVYLDMRELLEVLYPRAYAPKSLLRQLRHDEIYNKTIIGFIERYGGDMDAGGDSWAERQLEFILDIRGWETDQIESKVALHKAEWSRLWNSFMSNDVEIEGRWSKVIY